MVHIEIKSVFKRFQEEWIIKNFSHLFEAGSITGLSGRNGSGKTTLLRIIAGFLTSSKGEIAYSNQETIIPEDQWYKHLSFSAPYLTMNEELTAKELFEMFSSMKVFNNMNADQFLNQCYLTNDRNKYVKNYSSGMKQRLNLALCLLNESPVLLLDEPTSFLDSKAKEWFFELLSQRKSGKTVIIASNEAEDFKFCQNILEIGVN